MIKRLPPRCPQTQSGHRPFLPRPVYDLFFRSAKVIDPDKPHLAAMGLVGRNLQVERLIVLAKVAEMDKINRIRKHQKPFCPALDPRTDPGTELIRNT